MYLSHVDKAVQAFGCNNLPVKAYMHACSSKIQMCCCRLKDALKQVQYLQSSHRDSSSHHSVLQEQMHKLSGKVSQATHFLGGGKG